MSGTIVHKDISLLSQKSSLAGTEKIPVSSTEYITPDQIKATAVESSQPVGGMAPNTLYNLGTLSGAVTFVFAAPSDNNIENEYKFTFDSDSTPAVPTWPNTIIAWVGNCLDANGDPVIAASKHYEVSVVGGYGVIVEF